MKNQLTNLSPLQVIQNDIEEGSKNGKKYFPLRIWEHKFDLNHHVVVSILWAIEEKRVRAKKRIFIRHESFNERGRPCLSAIEIPKDTIIGRAKVEGERIKSERAAKSKADRHNRKFEATEEDMKKFSFKGKHILLSDSSK